MAVRIVYDQAVEPSLAVAPYLIAVTLVAASEPAALLGVHSHQIAPPAPPLHCLPSHHLYFAPESAPDP